MTVLVKTNTTVKKPTGVALVPVVRHRQVKRVHKVTASCGPPLTASLPVLMMLAMLSAAVVAIGVTSALVMAREYIKYNNIRYRATCTISTSKDMDYLVVDDVNPDGGPWFGMPAVQMKMYSSPSELINPRMVSQLLEEMAIEEQMETFTVRDGQRTFQIVHDFSDNLTSILSDERCFVMDLIGEFVLEPRRLIAGFHNQTQLDLSHAHSTFRAELPALPAPPARSCSSSNKPIYRLILEDTLVVRKRSITVHTTLPPAAGGAAGAGGAGGAGGEEAGGEEAVGEHDFVQFSGKHVHRMTVANMDDVISYELANSLHRAHPKLTVAPAPKE